MHYNCFLEYFMNVLTYSCLRRHSVPATEFYASGKEPDRCVEDAQAISTWSAQYLVCYSSDEYTYRQEVNELSL